VMATLRMSLTAVTIAGVSQRVEVRPMIRILAEQPAIRL
jgi:hypothetical protein